MTFYIFNTKKIPIYLWGKNLKTNQFVEQGSKILDISQRDVSGEGKET